MADRGDILRSVAAVAATGDARATRELLVALAPRVLRAARGVLGPEHADVEDAAQEALMAIVRALPAFRGESSVGHYASRIAVRTCLAARARGDERRRREGAAADAVRSAPAEHEGTTSARRQAMIRELLLELPVEQAEALALRVVLGLSMAEVAEAEQAPVNTVRSRLRLAKEALRRRIEGDPSLAELLEVGS